MLFVVKIVHKFHQHDSSCSVEDLVLEGFVGLINAVEKFDFKCGRFTTYAGYYITQRVILALQADKLISFSANCYDDMREARKVIRELLHKETLITPELLAEKMNITFKRANKVLRAISIFECDPLKLDVLINDEGLAAPCLVDKNPLPHEQVSSKLDTQWVLSELESFLTERELKILRMYYSDHKTLCDIGEEIGLTRERVRQIKAEALVKVRENVGFRL